MERRSYQRVKACLPLKVRVLSPQQVEEAKRACDILSACSSLSQLEEVIERSDLPLPLVEILMAMNKKLDLVLSLLTSGEDFTRMIREETKEVEISGSGLTFPSPHPFPVGTKLKISLLLPTAPFHIIEAIGEVVRVAKRGDRHLICVAFRHIGDDEREEIVRFTFEKQKEMLRDKPH